MPPQRNKGKNGRRFDVSSFPRPWRAGTHGNKTPTSVAVTMILAWVISGEEQNGGRRSISSVVALEGP